MEARTRIPPGLPRQHPTLSYWQDPPSPLAHVRTSPELPSTADYAIIGSGITGASIAHHLLARKPNASIVLLEARTACSGATGRNGGHTKAASYHGFVGRYVRFGADEAIRVAKLERATVIALQELAACENIQCDITPSETVDVFVDEGQWAAAKQATALMNKVCAGHDVEQYEIIADADEARRRFLVPDAIGAITYQAGSVSAYKLTVGILQLALAKGLNLQTNTAVDRVEQGNDAWFVHTRRGTVQSKQVILATNAYTAHLAPAFQGRIVPLRGHCCAQRPGTGLPKPVYPRTASFLYRNGYEYMVPRPPGSVNEGDIIIGGGRPAALPNEGLLEFGETDDTVVELPFRTYLEKCTADYWGRNWGEDHPDGRLRTIWTGIMGISADGVPYVGEMPGQKGLWICASFNGHGMVSCFKCAEAIATMLTSPQREADLALAAWFPGCFRLTSSRLQAEFAGLKESKPLPDYMTVVEGLEL